MNHEIEPTDGRITITVEGSDVTPGTVLARYSAAEELAAHYGEVMGAIRVDGLVIPGLGREAILRIVSSRLAAPPRRADAGDGAPYVEQPE